MRKRSEAAAAAVTRMEQEPMFREPAPAATPAGQIKFVTCPKCGLSQSEGSLRAGRCVRCGAAADAAQAPQPAAAAPQARRQEPPAGVPTAAPGKPSCGQCGARLTESALGLFYPCGHGDPRKAPQEPRPAGAPDAGEGREADAVSATWGTELFSPVQYNTCEVGPFTASVRARPGEDDAAAMRRAYALAEAEGEATRARKLASFAKALAELKGGAR